MVLLAAFETLLVALHRRCLTLCWALRHGRPKPRRVGASDRVIREHHSRTGEPQWQPHLPRFAAACTRSTTLDTFAHQDVPFEKLVEELRLG